MKNQEHWRTDKQGNFGIIDIDTTNVYGDNVWKKIEMVIASYAQVHPEEIREIIENNALVAKAPKSKSKLHYSVRIPVGLLFKLEQVEPKLFQNKKMLNQFMTKYKGFRVCQQ